MKTNLQMYGFQRAGHCLAYQPKYGLVKLSEEEYNSLPKQK